MAYITKKRNTSPQEAVQIAAKHAAFENVQERDRGNDESIYLATNGEAARKQRV